MGDLWPTTLKEAVCKRFNCAQELYEQRLFWRCLYRHALPVAALVHWLDPEYFLDVFREDFDFIREIGDVRDPDVFQVELDRFYGRNVRDKGWIRGALSVRISGKRLRRLKRRLFNC